MFTIADFYAVDLILAVMHFLNSDYRYLIIYIKLRYINFFGKIFPQLF